MSDATFDAPVGVFLVAVTAVPALMCMVLAVYVAACWVADQVRAAVRTWRRHDQEIAAIRCDHPMLTVCDRCWDEGLPRVRDQLAVIDEAEAITRSVGSP